jgi:hypothetical protein
VLKSRLLLLLLVPPPLLRSRSPQPVRGPRNQSLPSLPTKAPYWPGRRLAWPLLLHSSSEPLWLRPPRYCR